ncbi:MAG: ThiF family adenylyltransferase [Blastocatellia bacterium]|nr:ThiF family adenylyltransferase [Blastocatellia bacterium]
MSQFTIKPDLTETPFDRQERIGWWKQDILRQARILVVGAGALGNEALKNLLLLGATRILVIDFDTISMSNLSRTLLFRTEDIGQPKAPLAATRARDLALEPSAKIIGLNADLVWDVGWGLVRRMDLILGCVDNDEARLTINRMARAVGVPWINAGIFELTGSVTVFAGQAACFECAVTADQIADARSRYDSCEQVKKRYLETERLPTVQVTSAIVSGLQVQEAVKLLHGESVADGVKLVYNGSTQRFHTIQLPEIPHCLAHGRFEAIRELPASARTTTLEQFLDLVEQDLGRPVTVDLGRRFLIRIRCRMCSCWVELNRPVHRVFDDETFCPNCRTGNHTSVPTATPATTEAYVEDATRFSRTRFGSFEMTSDRRHMTLWEVGVPPLHLLSVTNDQGERFTYELTGDTTEFLADWDSEIRS